MVNALNPLQFETLLRRLGASREEAGARYEQLRRRLVTVFAYRHCADPEDLADQTMDRVARKLVELGDGFTGDDPTRFVFGVAWNIAKESFHRQRSAPLPDTLDLADPAGFGVVEDDGARGHECLERCLWRLPDADRALVLRYYERAKRERIVERSALAHELNISPNALRLRIHRLTQHLRDCVTDCLETASSRPVRLR
jgi:DNA-directed RNA polymerase specialized sigma24 family protein